MCATHQGSKTCNFLPEHRTTIGEESGCDIVTVQRLMGHSDLDTTRQYLDPDEKLKRSAVNKLSISGAVGK
jgi:integrase